MNQKRAVLVVEDDPILNLLLSKTLSRKGFEVKSAGCGEDALSLLTGFTPSVIITDYQMPGMTGDEFIERARKVHPTTPVLLISGNLSDFFIYGFLRFDRFSVLRKPFETEELITRLERLLALPLPHASSYARNAYRIDVETDVLVENRGAAKTQNVSATGMFLASDMQLRCGERITARFELSRPISIVGEVMWVRPDNSSPALPSGAGIRFIDLAEDTSDQLKVFLLSQLRRSNSEWSVLFEP